MKISFGAGYARCIKNFTPLKIIPKHASANEERFFIFDKKNEAVGSFCFSLNGCLHSLKLSQKIQRKKTAADAILSIRDFVIEKARERNIDFVFCYSDALNKNSVQRLYTHLGLPIAKQTGNNFSHGAMIPVDEKTVSEFMKNINDIAVFKN